MTTLFPGPNSIGLVTLNNSNANIGSVSILGGAVSMSNFTAPNVGNVTLNPSPNFIGLTTSVIGSAATLFAVVNTAAAGVGNSMVTLLAGPNSIGSVTLNNSNANIGSVSILGGVIGINSAVTLNSSAAYIGLTTSVIGNADAQAVPVYISGRTQTDEIISYTTSAAVAAAGTANHDYVVNSGKTLLVRSIQAAGSGKIKVALLGGTTVALGVQFNSTAEPNTRFIFDVPYEEAATNTFRVTLTNRDSSAQDVYTTLIGEEV